MFSFLKSTFGLVTLALVEHETFATFSGLEQEIFLTFSTFEHETIGLVRHEVFSFELSTVEQEIVELFELDIFSTTKLHNLNELLLY